MDELEEIRWGVVRTKIPEKLKRYITQNDVLVIDEHVTNRATLIKKSLSYTGDPT